MKIKFKSFNESVIDPFRSHRIRMAKGYRPKYKSGMIAVRFLNDDQLKDNGMVDEYPIDYQEIFNYKKEYMGPKEKRFIENFEKKYGIKLSKYKNDTYGYYIYFSCEQGTEKEKIEEISKDKIVKDVDYVDVRYIEGSLELEKLGDEIKNLSTELSDISDNEFKDKLNGYIERLKKLL